MILKQYYLGCLAHASYLIGDEESGRAAVVDPQRDIDVYVADADACHLSIDHVFLTHFHADFLAGHLELRDRTGAGIKLGAKASAEYAFEGVADGDDVDLGPQVRIRVLETPAIRLNRSQSSSSIFRPTRVRHMLSSPVTPCSSETSVART